MTDLSLILNSITSFLGLILCVWPKVIQLVLCLRVMASPDPSLGHEEDLTLGTLEGYVAECWEVAEGSEPGVERPGTAEWSLEGHPEECSAGEEKGEVQLQLDSSEAPLEVRAGWRRCVAAAGQQG